MVIGALKSSIFYFYFFRSGAADGTTVVIGALTMLKQFHMSVTHKFLAYLGQYVRCQVVLAAKATKVPNSQNYSLGAFE